ncbi:MAG: phosphoribosylglycinamide formyltransferase [Mahellales bacterium]|jgi:phosphoribosylglycinamide formyltransferase-1
MPVKKIAVMVSGGGSNLQAIIDGIENGYITNCEIGIVISNKTGVFALKRAEKAGIPSHVVRPSKFIDKDQYNRYILRLLKENKIDFIVLAGYLSILGPEIIEHYRYKIINIHPSLIPSFCGMGFYGSRVHKAVLDYGVKITGATVHFVDEQADTGPIILQQAVEVMDGDNVDTLSNRVLEVEHKLLPLAVKLLVEGRLKIEGRWVSIIPKEE